MTLTAALRRSRNWSHANPDARCYLPTIVDTNTEPTAAQELSASRQRVLLLIRYVRLSSLDQVRDKNREYGGRRDIAHEETPGPEQETVLQAQCLHGHVFRQPPADEYRI